VAASTLLFWQQQALDEAARAALNLGRSAEAEAAARALLSLPSQTGELSDRSYLDQPDGRDWGRVLLAQAVVEQGRRAEALKTLEPALAHYHDAQVQGAAYLAFRQHFARALYVQALAEPSDSGGMARGREPLDQAAALLQSLSDEARQLHDSQELLSWIAAAQKRPKLDAEEKEMNAAQYPCENVPWIDHHLELGESEAPLSLIGLTPRTQITKNGFLAWP
jgi:hypothetical protein